MQTITVVDLVWRGLEHGSSLHWKEPVTTAALTAPPFTSIVNHFAVFMHSCGLDIVWGLRMNGEDTCSIIIRYNLVTFLGFSVTDSMSPFLFYISCTFIT